MPKIPVYEQQVVPSQGLAAPRAVPDQTGRGLEAVGEGLDRVANAMYQVNQRREEEDNRIWLMNAERQFRSNMNTFEAEFRAKAAPGAKDYTPAFMKHYDAAVDEAVKNAPNQRVANLYRARLGEVGLAYQSDALRYEAGERVRYRKEQMFTGIDTEANLAMAKPADAERLLGERLALIDSLEGVDPGDKAEMREYARKNVAWYSTLGQIESNPGGWKPGGSMWNLLNADERIRAEKYAEQKRTEAEAKWTASALIGIARETVDGLEVGVDGYVDLASAKATAVARARASGVELDEEKQYRLESYVAQMANERERLARRERDGALAETVQALRENGGDLMALQAERPELLGRLTPAYQIEAQTFAEAQRSGANIVTDGALVMELVKDPRILASVDLDSYATRINAKDLNALKQQQAELAEDLENNQSMDGITNAVNFMLGGNASQDKKGKFWTMLTAEVNGERRATKTAKLSQDRILEIASRLVTEVEIPGFNKAAYEVERKEIIAALEAQGITDPTEAEIGELYARMSQIRRESALPPVRVPQ